jgi:general secretion pathway protein K
MGILRQQRGAALLLVLVIIALLTTLVIELAFSTLVDLRLTETFRDSAQAYYLAKGGIHAGQVILKDDSNGYDARNDSAELWSQGISNYPVGPGVLSVTMNDLGGKLNINSLLNAGGGNNVDSVVKLRFYHLFTLLALEDPQGLTAALIDWIDQNSEPYVDADAPGSRGAEDADYLRMDPPGRCKNGPITVLDELGAVRGFTSEIIRAIRPHVTTFGSDKVNINTATVEVLMSLSEDPVIDRPAAETIIAYRDTEPFKTEDSLKWLNSISGLENLLRSDFSVTSSYYSIAAEAWVNDGSRRVNAVVKKPGGKLLYLRVD